MNTSILPRTIILLLVSISVGYFDISAQQKPDKLVEDMMETAVSQMNDGDYESANLTFRKILKLNKVLPDDLSYLFAETLYMVHQIHNSRNFLDKYIRLVGSNGRYYSQAMDLRHFLDDEYELILMCKLCDNKGYRLITCDTCEGKGKITNTCYSCRGVGITRCGTCTGEGVTTSFNAFGALQYQTCHNCEGKAKVICKQCEGKKVLSDSCPACNGTQKKPGKEICEHETTAFGVRHRMIGTFE